MSELREQIRTYVETTVERIDSDDVVAAVSSGTDVRDRAPWSTRPVWVAAGAALLVLLLVGVPIVLLSRGEDVIADQPTTTVPPTTAPSTSVPPTTVPSTTVAPSPQTVVPDAWNSILADTRANAAPPAATCPPGSDPNSPGMVDQARPNPGYAGNQAVAFDRHTGRIVYVDAAYETWTFDVCTNTWEQMNPIGAPGRYPDGLLVYDADSDRVISLRATSSSVYDPNANTWTRISDREAMPGDHPTGSWLVSGAVYDPVSGLVLAQYDQLGVQLTVLSAYDVDTDRWTLVGPLDGRAWRNLIGYAPQTDRLIFAGYGDGGGLGMGDDTGDRHYSKGQPLVVDPRTGSALATGLGASIMGAYSILSYAADTDTALVQTRPDNKICWFDPRSLTWDNCLGISGYPTDVVGRRFNAMVGDPINNRLVLINPSEEFDTGEPPAVGAVWAVDLDTGNWTQLLAPPTP